MFMQLVNEDRRVDTITRCGWILCLRESRDKRQAIRDKRPETEKLRETARERDVYI